MKIKEGGGMDLQKEREAFEAVTNIYHCIYNADLNYYFSGSQFVGNKAEIAVNAGWKAWQAAKAQAVPEWISVENELPKRNIKVLLNIVARRRGKPFSCIGFYSVEPDDEPCFILDDNFTILKGVTHWMPLPDAPQEPAND